MSQTPPIPNTGTHEMHPDEREGGTYSNGAVPLSTVL